MKITLILIEIRSDIPGFTGNYYEGVGAVSAALKGAGNEVSFLHLTRPIGKAEFSARLRQDSPDMVAFSAMTNGFHYAKEMAGWVKEFSGDVTVLCGGIHATLDPEDVISVGAIDYVCRGEGEEPMVELCDALDKGKSPNYIANIWLRDDERVIRNKVRSTYQDLDRFPHPDRDIFDFDNLLTTKESFATFLGGRGCPFACAYCANHGMKDLYPNKGQYIRFKTVDRLMDEIEVVLKRYPYIKYVAFSDDILPLKIDWLREFAEKYKARIGRPFKCNINPMLVKDETISLLHAAGCTMVEIGVESGNEKIRREVLNRKITNEGMLKATRLIRSFGMKIATYNMVGVPGESIREIRDTIKLNGLIGPEKMYAFIFYPYPGTRLHAFCKKEGLLTESRFDTYAEGTILKSKTLTEKEVVFGHRFFRSFAKLYKKANKLPAPFSRISVKALDMFIVARLPYGLLISTHSVLYKTASFMYLKFGRHIYNRQKAYYG